MNSKKFHVLVLSGVMLVSFAFCGAAVETEFSSEQVLRACRKAADWQIDNPNRTPFGDWAQGPFINGLFAISQMPGNERYLDEVINIGEKEKWGVITTIHPANDHCTPQTWLDIYKIKKDPKMLAPIRKALDEYIKAAEMLDDNLDFTKANRKKWSWCDALYMSPPTFARMYKFTGDKKYLDYMHKWWWKVSDYDYDTDEHLYYRDETFFKKREPNGKKVFWSRGNGWVVGGLVRVLQVLDTNDPLRPKYVTQFKEMCNRLADIQSDHGLWHPGLLDPEAHRQPETSGSAFFVYAMAYGINEGILDRNKFMPVIKKAWAGLCRHLKDDGRFAGIQPVGDSPGKYDPNYTMPYGVGAFLLAGSEVYQLSCGKTDNKSETALVFLIAGQSNAGGVAAFSPESNKKAGMQEKHPTNPGSTAKEVGIPTTKEAYPKSYIFKPGKGPFERLTPGENLQTCYRDPWRQQHHD